MSRLFEEKESALLLEIMRLRRDVRGNRFTPQAVSKQTIDKLLAAALHAPSVGYSQPWQFVVVRNNEIKQQVFNSFTIENEHAVTLFSDQKQQQYKQLKLEGIVEAPVNIAVFYQPSKEPVLGQTSMSEMGKFSVVCAIQNLWLMARSLNVGVGWVSIVDPEVVKAVLGAPSESELVGYLCVGYVSEFLEQPELKSKAWQRQKQQQDVVFYDGFTA